jgi:hypothetical protein
MRDPRRACVRAFFSRVGVQSVPPLRWAMSSNYCARAAFASRHSLAVSTSFHPDDDAPNDARRAPTAVRRQTLDVLSSQLTLNATRHHCEIREMHRTLLCVCHRRCAFLLNTSLLAYALHALSIASLCSSRVFCPLLMSFAHLSVLLQIRDLQ